MDIITDRHRGETIYVIGKGPSLCGFEWEKLRGKIVIAMNSVVVKIPFANYWIFFDSHKIATQPDWFWIFEGSLIFCRRMNSAKLPDDYRLLIYEDRITTQPVRKWGKPLYYGNTTATLAVHLAAIMGAKRIELLGIDLGDAGTPRESVFVDDIGVPEHKIFCIASAFVYLAHFLEEWGIEAITRCRYEDGEPVTNLRNWQKKDAPLVFPAEPLRDLPCR